MLNLFFESLVSRLKRSFDLEHFGSLIGEFLIELVSAFLILAVFYLLWRIVRLILSSRLARRLDRTSAAFAETVIKFGIFGVGVLTALGAIGIKTSTLLGSLGVLGLTLGFALRDTLSNIISGILIFIDRPFTINDLIEIDNNYGRVEKITLRTTRIVTVDGKMLAVPNAVIMNKTVTSYTNFPHLRLDIAVTIAVTENIDRARLILLSLVAEDPDCMKTPKPEVVVTTLNDYNVVLELRVWVDNEREHIQKRLELREKVFKALTDAGVQMPYETIQLAPHQVEVVTGDKNGTSISPA
ncbi:MAG: mechanosensitive ion channel family protein [Chlorobiaceae bacterium]|nr:mechanosensitive ion channel family protein [Chlorobiaceae bacterium]